MALSGLFGRMTLAVSVAFAVAAAYAREVIGIARDAFADVFKAEPLRFAVEGFTDVRRIDGISLSAALLQAIGFERGTSRRSAARNI